LSVFLFAAQNSTNPQDYNLIISEAKKSHLEKDSEVQEEINKVLYKHYVQKLLKQNPAADLSKESLKKIYDERPLVRYLELMVPTSDTKTLEQVKKALAKKTSFTKLVMKYSIAPNSTVGGDTDYQGSENLPRVVYNAALKLKKGAISEEIFLNGYSYFIQLVDIKKFEDVPVTYLDYLKYEYLQEHESKVLANYLQTLKKSSP
jgi:parvulin-like peptidyl-prolyl isomerase